MVMEKLANVIFLILIVLKNDQKTRSTNQKQVDGAAKIS